MANADIVIIGGGIVGANLAYQLAVRGTTNITVLERDYVASGSTGRATGGLALAAHHNVALALGSGALRLYTSW